MPTGPRSEVFDPENVGVYHCTNRCVRQGYLCGFDTSTGINYEHRRDWLRGRIEALASIFAIEVGSFAILENHFHVLVRNRPDIAKSWSDEEVVRRYLRLSAKSLMLREEPSERQVHAVLQQPERVAELRQRLSHISVFMAMLDESVSRSANAEDECSGHFWQDRFGCQALTSEAAILACAVYIDLNLIRAMIAETPETSRYTSVHERIHDRLDELAAADAEGKLDSRGASDASDVPSARGHRRSGWLVPISIEEGDGYDGAGEGRRASNRGLLSLPLEKYLELVDWSGRQLRHDKRGVIPGHLKPLLERLGLVPREWLKCLSKFRTRFGPIVGPAQDVHARAIRRGKKRSGRRRECQAAFGDRSPAPS